MNKKVIFFYLLYVGLVFSYFIFAYPLVSFDDSNYAAIAHAIYFSKLPIPFLLLFLCIKNNWIKAWKIKFHLHNFWSETIIVSYLLLFCYELSQILFDIVWFIVTHRAGTSHESLLSWFQDQTLDFAFLGFILTILLLVFRLVIKRWTNKWYFVLWLFILPIAIIVVYVQPVLIDPLYQDFSPLQEGALRTAIEQLTEDAGLIDPTILAVDMSEKVSTFNAYVTGIFGNARIVLWDTTLNELNQNEILFILAHEIGHYTMHHVYIGLTGYILFTLLLLFFIARCYHWIMKKKYPYYKLSDIQAIPILLFIVLIFVTIGEPMSLFVSRQMEKQADQYAIEHTEDLEPALDGYKRIAVQSKSDIEPLDFVKWMRYSHPPMLDRIERIKRAMNE
ncbi:Protease HtpX [Paraliobacillus sp. PM-2]|uniref:M48 family metalloprotease n=1 Tax=Paraliobacillus sp. PM-2 TaxID=1462524 RepID=UPI00061B9EED|nr:M48 family metalloprotease [Paraliobacillus sp. PM-2]CQR47021.1 Protease HtpX [Paraliobacillus sp. PM-2]